MSGNTRILYLTSSKKETEPISAVLRDGRAVFEDLTVGQEEFSSAVGSFDPEVILALEMPFVAAAVESIKDMGKQIPLILIVDNSSEDSAIKLLFKGVEDYLLKDRLERLPKAVANAVEKYRLQESVSTTAMKASVEFQEREASKITENQYKLLFQAGPLPKWIYDRNTYEILDVNDAAVRHYGFSRPEFLSMTLMDLRPKELIPSLYRKLEKARAEKENIRFRRTIHHKKDGSLMTVDIFGFNLKFKGIESTLVVCQDTTEREAFIEALTDKSEKLQTAESIAKLGYWELDPRNKSVYWSDEVYTIFGKSKESDQPEWNEVMRIIHPEDAEEFDTKRAAALSGKQPLDTEHRIILPDQSIRWIHLKGSLKRERQGELRFKGTIQDITERKEAEEKLRLSESRHLAILQSQTNYLMRTDFEGRYTYYNEKFLRDFSWAYPDNEVLGQWALYSVKEYHKQQVKDTFHKAISQPGKVFQVEIDKERQDGGVQHTLWDIVCLTDSKGELEIQCVGIDISEWIKTKQALEESNIRYELVSKATSDAIWDLDVTRDQLNLGEGFKTFFGYELEKMSGARKWWEDHLHPEDVKNISNSLDAFFRGDEKIWQAEYRFKKADGSYAYISDRGFAIRDGNQQVLRLVGAAHDITERKKLESLLEMASLLSRVGSFEFHLEKKEVFWSPMVKEIHEVDPDFTPSLEKGLQFVKEGDHSNNLRRAFEQALEHGTSIDLEFQITTAKGNDRWLRLIGKLEYSNGKCVSIHGSIQDIEEIKGTQLIALKASEEKEEILESIGDAFFTVNHDWVITYWNRHASRILLPREEALGRNLWEVFPDAIGTSFYTRYHKAVREKSVEHFEEFFTGTGSWYEVTAYPAAHGLSVYFVDISDRKRGELELLELNKNLQKYTDELVTANKGLEQFSYIVSHNLRSPVANILGIADILRLDEQPAEVREILERELLENVKRLDEVITDLNRILQMKGDISEKKEKVRFSDLVDTISLGIEGLVQKEHVQLKTDFSEKKEFSTVKTYLYSIFQNLIHNSIKYRRQEVPPIIEIRTERKAGILFLSFKDNGIGIDLERKGDQIFKLYKRFHDHVEGKGMGLFMVKTQVELLGGRISVNSEVNKGTEFILEFEDDE